jgi:hypothetical protein
LATLRMQMEMDLGPLDWSRIDASGPPEASAEAWIATVGEMFRTPGS